MKNPESGHEHHFEWSKRSLAFVIGLLIAISAFIVLSTAPFAGLLGPSAYALGSALHGMMAFFLLVVSIIALYLAWRLFMGRIKVFPDLQLVTTVMATLTFLTIVFGNWIYIPYRAKTPDSPRSYFLEHMPEVHSVFFEFKEFTALFTLPLSVAAAFILWRYGRHILERNWTRTSVAILIALHFFYFVLAFGLGAAVTKLKSI
jgi:cytochrome bd-type quinol oxidase subunit 1